MSKKDEQKVNRLIDEKSPYLLQHASNPVDWYPWGSEAFERAAREDKPVFLSIGYSTCHWCHVMEKESFEDVEVAALLNEYFVSIKVDREERPDLDQVYMNACQAMTGQGGWPLSVFLTADKKPFFAATYIPKQRRGAMTGMVELLPRLAEVWKTDRDRIEESARRVTEALGRGILSGQGGDAGERGAELPGKETLEGALNLFEQTYDPLHGGFGEAPKFPAPHQLQFLLRYGRESGREMAVNMALSTLKKIHSGGIFDQLGFGVHRYSVDKKWLVPHFEKMLYDQATTAAAALDAYQASGDEEAALLARRIFSYVLRDLASKEGGFYSAEDADSEGEEGTFYVWRREEFSELLGAERGALVADYYGVSAGGNFEGKNVLHRPLGDGEFAAARGLDPARLQAIVEESRPVLLKARESRTRPFLDDKIITAWNALIIAALARGGAVLGERVYTEAAGRAADFILEEMSLPGGRLYRRYRDGQKAVSAFLEDYAFMVHGLLELYRATSDGRRLQQARRLVQVADELFNRKGGRLLFGTGEEEPAGLALDADAYDGAMPSGVSVAAGNYLRLGRLLRDGSLLEKGRLILKAQAKMIEKFPTGHAGLLSALAYFLSEPEELTIAGSGDYPGTEELAAVARRAFKPHLDLLFNPGGAGKKDPDPVFELCPFLREMQVPENAALAHYCRDMRCLPPVGDKQKLKVLLEGKEG